MSRSLYYHSKRVKGTINHQLYTTWAFTLRGRNIFYTLRRERTTAGTNAPGAFLVTPPSGQGLVIPIFCLFFYPAVRVGSSNTRLFRSFFFHCYE